MQLLLQRLAAGSQWVCLPALRREGRLEAFKQGARACSLDNGKRLGLAFLPSFAQQREHQVTIQDSLVIEKGSAHLFNRQGRTLPLDQLDGGVQRTAGSQPI